MVKLDALMDPALLTQMLAEGYIRRAEHPTLPLAILNYTARAQYDRVWNEATRQARGLIVAADGTVVAHPFPKFFNLGEPGTEHLPVEPFTVHDKLDGSLGVLYPTPDGYAVATRGSFTSTQARHATRVWRQRYSDRFHPAPGRTHLFEIIYAANRIVVDYGDLDDLVLLAVMDTETGVDLPGQLEDVGWPGSVARRYHGAADLAQLAADERANAEGYVVRFASGLRVKVKLSEYRRLFRIVASCSTVVLWRSRALADLAARGLDAKRAAFLVRVPVAEAETALAVGDGWLAELLDHVPDEFYQWVKRTLADLDRQFADVLADWHGRFRALRLDALPDRAAKAARIRAQQPQLADVMFALLDGRDIAGAVWRHVRPAFAKPYVDLDEDVA